MARRWLLTSCGTSSLAALDGDNGAIERLAERDLLWYDASELDRLADRGR